METVVIFAIAGCLFSAAVVYVVLDYHRHGERQEAMENVLSVQAKVNAAKKTMGGYTKFTDYLAVAKPTVTDRAKSLQVKVVREHVYTENVKTEEMGAKAEATAIVKYSAEYIIGFDLKPESFEILATTAGIDIKLRKPTLLGTPYVNIQLDEIGFGGVLHKDKEVFRDLHGKLASIAQQQGAAVSAEETVRALCDKKLATHVANFLAGQAGVTQVPVISVVYT